jgi:hypothetical protein
MNDGKSFESLVAEFYRRTVAENPGMKVSQNRRITGPDGDREFDVVIEAQVADFLLVTVIECKDYGRLVNVTTVDAFASKLEDIRAAKGVLVSRKGFTRSALDKARRLNISACTLDQASKVANDSELNIPILLRRLEFGKMSSSIKLTSAGTLQSLRFDANSLVCDLGIMDIVKLIDPQRLIAEDSLNVQLSHILKGQELWVRETDGSKKTISDASLGFEITSPVHFGFLADLPSSLFKRDEISSDTCLVFSFQDFQSIEGSLRSYRRFSDVPDYAKGLHLTAIVVPERIESIGRVSMYGYK